MYLKYIQIVNFRNNKSGVFEFNKGANTVIGENDSGKTNAMTAIRILLDSDFYYTTKRLKESDFSKSLDDWRGHWIIISAFFDEITEEDRDNDVCRELNPDIESADFLSHYIRSEGESFGTVTLYIRPSIEIRRSLFNATTFDEISQIRASIRISDYEFFYTSRSQANYIDDNIYKLIVGDFDNNTFPDPDSVDERLIGVKTNITDIWQHVSIEYIDALRDVELEMRKNKNPLRRMFETVQDEIAEDDKNTILQKVSELNQALSAINEVEGIGKAINEKLHDIVGLVYSPEISIESKIKEDIVSIGRYLSLSTPSADDIDYLGLGHLNILYIAMKMVEFEINRNHEILNVMILEEPEAHIHTHIQRALFDNLRFSQKYTQVIMTTHSTHISEVANISNMNVLKAGKYGSVIMRPSNGLDTFGKDYLKLGSLSLSQCVERYLDAKRSVLLFSKGVVLVEGDAEEILIPALVKVALGVSLDELGIGVINVGSVAFEYIASCFSEQRIQKRCAIITDSDSVVIGAKECSEFAAKLAETRKAKLAYLYDDNPWVESFFAPHTFEVDFSNIVANRSFIKELINIGFSQPDTIKKYKSDIDGSEAARYDATIGLSKQLGKGWMATILSQKIDRTVKIPDYIIRAIAFASQEILSEELEHKMLTYAVQQLDDSTPCLDKYIEHVRKNDFTSLKTELITMFPDNNLSRYLSCLL